MAKYKNRFCKSNTIFLHTTFYYKKSSFRNKKIFKTAPRHCETRPRHCEERSNPGASQQLLDCFAGSQ